MSGTTTRSPVLHERLIRHVDLAIWSQIKVTHAQWQVKKPTLKMRDTLAILLLYALEHAPTAWDQEFNQQADETEKEDA